MPDDKSSRGIQQESVQQVAATKPVNPPAPPYNPPGPPAQSVSDNRMEGAIHAVEDRVKRAEWLMIGLTAGIVALTLGLVIVGVLQWNAMSGQLNEMKGSSRQTDQLIDKTRILAENAGKQAERTQVLADRMKDQADRTKTIAEQAVIQAQAAKVLAEATKSAATTTSKQLTDFENSERAILRVDVAWNETTGNIYFTVRNTGRTLAHRINYSEGSGALSCIGGPIPASQVGNTRTTHPYPGGFELAAGDTSDPQVFTSASVTDLRDSFNRSHLCPSYMVTVAYDDVFGKEWKSFGCLMFRVREFSKCRIIDDIKATDDNQHRPN